MVAAICPSTNPAATPVNKAMMAVKGGNSIIVAPSPAGYRTSAKTVELMRSELSSCGMPEDLVQALPSPVTRQATLKLVEAADLAVVTGSQNNVRAAMRSGTVSLGVRGPGGCRQKDPEVQDLRLRNVMLLGELADHSGRHIRDCHEGARERGWVALFRGRM